MCPIGGGSGFCQSGKETVGCGWTLAFFGFCVRRLGVLVSKAGASSKRCFLGGCEVFFSLKPKILFYDLTSFFFRSGRSGGSRFCLGSVGTDWGAMGSCLSEWSCDNNWPMAYHVSRGDLQDAETVQTVMEDLRESVLGSCRVLLPQRPAAPLARPT
jgi:hypothetical protein